jgi:glycosyltransferase involved in cell wall biosynthesis
MWVAFWARTLGVSIPVLAFTFNFAELPKGRLRRLAAARMFASIERFVIFSSMERQLYAAAFGLPEERFDMIHWSVAPPECSEGRIEEGDYVCAIGGNARDYGTLLKAAAQLPEVPFVLVVRPENLEGMSVPANVRVHVNLTFAKSMNILKHSRFMVLPLAGSEVPCGHVTLVAAMHLGRTFIITNSSGVSDYVIDGVNSVSCAAFDAPALANSVRALWQDPERIRALEQNAARFVIDNCSEQVAIDHLRRVLESYRLLDSSKPAVSQSVATSAEQTVEAAGAVREQQVDAQA